MRAKFRLKIRISKSGPHPTGGFPVSKQIQISKIQVIETLVDFLSSFVLNIGTLGFRICIGFRASGFEFYKFESSDIDRSFRILPTYKRKEAVSCYLWPFLPMSLRTETG